MTETQATENHGNEASPDIRNERYTHQFQP